MFIPFASDPRRHARAITFEIVAVGIIVILAMWAMVIASITAAREAAMDRTRSDGHNLAVAFADEVLVLDSGSTDRTVHRRGLMMRGWRRSIPRAIASPATAAGIRLRRGRGKFCSISPASGS